MNEAGFWTARRAAALACALALALAAAEFAVIGRLELSFDEAYYTLWSRRLAFGYFDHPPMVAVWIRLSTLIFGASEFGVRALNVVAFALSPAMIGFGAARLFDSPRVGAFAALAWLAMPLTAAAFLATPDTPLTIFSIVALMGLIEVCAAGLGAGRSSASRWAWRCSRNFLRFPGWRNRPRSDDHAVAAPLVVFAGALCGGARGGGDLRAVRRLERDAWVGDVYQAVRPCSRPYSWNCATCPNSLSRR